LLADYFSYEGVTSIRISEEFPSLYGPVLCELVKMCQQTLAFWISNPSSSIPEAFLRIEENPSFEAD